MSICYVDWFNWPWTVLKI